MLFSHLPPTWNCPGAMGHEVHLSLAYLLGGFPRQGVAVCWVRSLLILTATRRFALGTWIWIGVECASQAPRVLDCSLRNVARDTVKPLGLVPTLYHVGRGART